MDDCNAIYHNSQTPLAGLKEYITHNSNKNIYSHAGQSGSKAYSGSIYCRLDEAQSNVMLANCNR
jgi:hypothetical protein